MESYGSHGSFGTKFFWVPFIAVDLGISFWLWSWRSASRSFINYFSHKLIFWLKRMFYITYLRIYVNTPKSWTVSRISIFKTVLESLHPYMESLYLSHIIKSLLWLETYSNFFFFKVYKGICKNGQFKGFFQARNNFFC